MSKHDSEQDSFDEGSEDDEMGDEISLSSVSSKPMTQAEKRAHHNALERKRRDHIKDSFTSLRDSVPSLHGEKVSKRISSRAQILKKAAEYIQFMRRKNSAHQHDIEDLKRQNHILENQIRSLERARMTGNMRSATLSSSSSTDLKMKTRLSESDEHDGSDGDMNLNITSPISATSSTSSVTGSSGGSTKKLKVLSIGSK